MPRTHQDEAEKCCKPRSARSAAGQGRRGFIQSAYLLCAFTL